MNLAHSHSAVKAITVDAIYPALWAGDAATISFTEYNRRYDARLRITDGSAVLLPWPVSHTLRIFHDERQTIEDTLWAEYHCARVRGGVDG